MDKTFTRSDSDILDKCFGFLMLYYTHCQMNTDIAYSITKEK